MPVLNAVDYSYARPSVSALKAAGIQVVCRYLTGSGKAVSRAEVAALHAAGIGVLLNFEASAGNAAAGARQGAIDGEQARAAVATLGAPVGLPIYYSVDFDATPGQMSTVLAYLKAADNPTHPSRCYGSFKVVEAFGRPGWQTYAWSYGQLSHLAVIYQWSNNHTLGGGAVDYNEIRNRAQLGAWEAHPPPPPPPAKDWFDMATEAELAQVIDARMSYWLPRLAAVIRTGDPNTAFTAKNSGADIDYRGLDGVLADLKTELAAIKAKVGA